MSRRFRPYRNLRRELLSLAIGASIPIALIVAFPFAALHPPPAAACADEAACAFVTLTPDEERQARKAARAAWQTDRSQARNRRIDLFEDALPPMRPRMALDMAARSRATPGGRAAYKPDLLPPTLAAPPPVKIAPLPNAESAVPPFSRDELLRLDR